MFRKLAEIAGEYLRKGSKVYIEGKLQTRQWEREGQKHYTTEIVADQMQMLDSRGGGGGGMGGGGYDGPPQRDQGNTGYKSQDEGFSAPPADDFDDDIPF